MPCDKFMELPLEVRLGWLCPDSSSVVDSVGVAYRIRVNPNSNDVEYQFPPSSLWVPAR